MGGCFSQLLKQSWSHDHEFVCQHPPYFLKRNESLRINSLNSIQNMIKTLINYSRINKLVMYFCFLGLLCAQKASVAGLIINDQDQTPIHGANIYLEELAIGTISQVDGRFIINDLSHGEISLTISMIGFKDVNRSLVLNKDSHDLGKVFMSRDTIKIQEIVVDAHHELRPHEFASNVYFSGEEYHENLKSTLALTLQQETGLSIQSMGQATAKPVLRGYSGDRFLLTENGVTIGDLSNTSIDHAISIDMASFNNVRIIRGPESLLFGSNTIGGVIDVSRQSSLDLRLNKISFLSLVGAESSSKGAFGNFTLYFPINFKHQLRLSFLERYSGNQRSPLGILDNTDLSNNELAVSYSYFGRSQRSTLTYEQTKMDYGIPGSPEGHINGVDIKMSKSSQRYNYHKDISFLNFQTFDLDQRFINYNHSEFVKDVNSPSVSMGQKIFSLQGKFTGDQLTMGSLFQYRDFKAGGFYWTPDTEEIRVSAFGLFQKNIKDLTLQISSRVEYLSIMPETSLFLSNLNDSEVINRDFTILSGSVGLYRSWNNWKLSLGTMMAGRTPDLDELYSDGPHLGTYSYEIGQPNLELERTISVEASLEHNTPKSQMRLTGYQNYSPNYHISTAQGTGYEPGADWIEWGSGSSGWLYKYQMRGLRAQIYGWESDLRYELKKWIHLGGSISVTRGENLSQNRALEYMPPDKVQFLTEFDLEPFSMALNLKNVFPQTRLGEFETKTDGYFIADLNGSFTIRQSKVTHKIIFQIDNIFDEVYYNHLSRIKQIMPERGQNFSMQYRLVF